METRICLDTNILVDVLRNQTETPKIIKKIENNILATTYINLFELNYGAALSANKKINFKKVDKLISRLELLNLSENSTKIAAMILADLKNKGKMIEFKDLLVASICITNNFQLFTKNTKHFEDIPRLNLYTP
ncbi:MAG: type II toxin-antitoxin system VapC family toxin [Nanoarchaeota archaeon]